MQNKHVLITGGAGFIGSHLAEYLLSMDNSITIVDDLSVGSKEWIPEAATFIQKDLRNPKSCADIATSEFDTVFHLAANKSVNTDQPREQFHSNSKITHNILEAIINCGISHFVYTSSSTVYGEAPRPTPEDYAQLEPISLYGASKLADEGLCSAYAHSHDLIVHTFRFANIIGPRLRGAVIPDFIKKLRENPERLVILGNGHQKKSFMHVTDCIDAMVTVIENTDRTINTYNLGTQTTTSVNQIADIISEELGYDPDYEYTGGDRGWTGDVPKMHLSIEKLSALGWKPEMESDEAVQRATRELIEEMA